MKFILIPMIAVVGAFLTRYVHHTVVFNNTGRIYPFVNEDLAIFLAVWAVIAPAAFWLLGKSRAIYEGMQATAAFTGQQAAKNSYGLKFTFGVITALVLGPALQFALFNAFISMKGSSDGAKFAMLLLALFAWIPGGIIGGLIANAGQKSSFKDIGDFAVIGFIGAACVWVYLLVAA